MNLNNARYELTAVRPEQYPKESIPEITFVGRSNVGKSSIINSLLRRKNLARTGSTPGKTREINFYNIDGRLYFVDLPGYGYAGVSKTQKASWGGMIETYLSTRLQIRLIIMLVDIRHKPSEDDTDMYRWILENEIPHVIAATKADKVTRSQVGERLKDIGNCLNTGENAKIIPYSSGTGLGREDLWKEILSVLPEGI